MPINMSKTPVAVVDDNDQLPRALQLRLAYAILRPKQPTMETHTVKRGGLLGRLKDAVDPKTEQVEVSVEIDLDAMLLLFNHDDQLASVAAPGEEDPFGDESVFHTGDAVAVTGGGAESSQRRAVETIIVHPRQVMNAVKSMVLAVVAYGNSNIGSQLAQLRFQMTDGEGNILADELLSIEDGVQGSMLVKFTRNGQGGWNIQLFSHSFENVTNLQSLATQARSLRELQG